LKEEALDRTVWRNRFGRGFRPVVWQITDDDDDDDDFYNSGQEICRSVETRISQTCQIFKSGSWNTDCYIYRTAIH